MNKKELVVKYKPLVSLACRIHNLWSALWFRGCRGNRVEASCALLKKVKIRFSGKGNRVIIGDFCTLENTTIYIAGSGNTLHIGPWCHVIRGDFYIEDDGNAITLGEHTWFLGNTHLAAIEGTRITIGPDCLFSSDIQFRTGDSHSILDASGRRINPSRDITLGRHVWVGAKATCLKGATISDNSIVGTGALVTGTFEEPGCVLAGVPAKVVRRNISWHTQRIPVGSIAPGYELVEEEKQA